ncbi:hypothetical protein VB774_18740 [Pseudanabaena galeata UHCC 0370]|uniref:Uncharacterized protein n=2 Tax=Pseudanabaena galeata TaxID=1112103 RepID=A0ABU5TMW1_9CYAN|nr:hypothetical protein [Pseudanabaena galeata UHCC 0370]
MTECDRPMAERVIEPFPERSRREHERRQTNYPRGGDLSATFTVPSTSLRELGLLRELDLLRSPDG